MVREKERGTGGALRWVFAVDLIKRRQVSPHTRRSSRIVNRRLCMCAANRCATTTLNESEDRSIRRKHDFIDFSVTSPIFQREYRTTGSRCRNMQKKKRLGSLRQYLCTYVTWKTFSRHLLKYEATCRIVCKGWRPTKKRKHAEIQYILHIDISLSFFFFIFFVAQ